MFATQTATDTQVSFTPAHWSHDELRDMYFPVDQHESHRTSRLRAGTYKIGRTMQNPLIFNPFEMVKDNLVQLPNTVTTRVIRSMHKFWQSKEIYKRHSLVYKRGILLYGPPGSGKTAILQQVITEAIDHDCVVILASNPELLSYGVRRLRTIEPDRPIAVVFEDIDDVIENYGEQVLLSVLDGEDQFGNIVVLATTNYQDKLPARIVNRPSRFDEVILVGMPSEDSRFLYLKHVIGAERGSIELTQWAKDTEGFSIAHLRELAVAVHFLDNNYQDTLERLKKMASRPEAIDGFTLDANSKEDGDD